MKKFKTLLSLGLALVLMAGCSKTSSETAETPVEEPAAFEAITVTDAMGREVAIEKEVESVLCIGPGALRMYVYINGSEKLAGVEDIDKTLEVDKTYLTAHPEIMQLDTIGQGGPMNPPDLEKLVEVGADVIFTTYANSPEEANEMQEKTGSKVLVLSNGRMTVFEDELYNSLLMIGDVMNKKDRATELVDFMKNLQADLMERTKNVEPKMAYVGGIGFKGARGLLSTRSNFNLFQAVNVQGYVDDVKEKAPIMLDKEKLLELDPEIIFFDINGGGVAAKEYQEDPAFFDSLQAVKNNKVYGILSYNNYATNVDTAMLDAYYIGMTMYPDAFADVKLEEKAEEIYTLMLGTNVYAQLMEAQNGFKEYSFSK